MTAQHGYRRSILPRHGRARNGIRSGERGRNMLPGTRTFSDDDIVTTVREALTVFDKVDAIEDGIPDELRPLVFQTIVNMVGNRQIVGGLPAMHISRQ